MSETLPVARGLHRADVGRVVGLGSGVLLLALGFALLLPIAAGPSLGAVVAQAGSTDGDAGEEEGEEEESPPPPAPTKCPAGTYSATGNVPEGGTCTRVEAGFETTGANAEDLGATGQRACRAGFYKEAPGAGRCKEVPKGSEATGAAGDGTAATGIRQCLEGTFQDEVGRATCKPAPAGRFVATKGAQSATLCPVGTFQDETGKTSCKPAPAGSHVPTTGATTFALCAPGTYTTSTGASQCTAASVGFYVPRPGATAQLACPTVTTTGSATCPIPTGPTTTLPSLPTGDEPLSPQGDECPPGTWSPTGTAGAGSTCTPARPGTFVAVAGATEEVQCQPGTYSDGFGATSCTPAPIGTYVPTAGAMDPVECPSATQPGQDFCDSALAVAAPDGGADGGGMPWLLILAVVLVVGGGAVGFVVLQRRTGALVPDDDDLSATSLLPLDGIDATAVMPPVDPAWGSSSATALEWDEELDGPGGGVDDEDGPPASPRR
jgi:hypothetical protein